MSQATDCSEGHYCLEGQYYGLWCTTFPMGHLNDDHLYGFLQLAWKCPTVQLVHTCPIRMPKLSQTAFPAQLGGTVLRNPSLQLVSVKKDTTVHLPSAILMP